MGGWDDFGRFEEEAIPLQIQRKIQYVDGTVGDCFGKTGFIANTKKDTKQIQIRLVDGMIGLGLRKGRC